MNPYSAIRATLRWTGIILKALLCLIAAGMMSLLGYFAIGWWGVIVVPLALLVGFVLYALIAGGIGYAVYGVSEWLKRKDREYRTFQRTAHGESNKLAA